MSYCPKCGLPHQSEEWPRVCVDRMVDVPSPFEQRGRPVKGCGHEEWERINPIIAVLQPILDRPRIGLAIARRADNKGWALIAGHVNPRETVEEAVVREWREETGFNHLPPEAARYFASLYNPHGALILCYTLPPMELAHWKEARLCDENLEFGVMWDRRDVPLCFPLHQELVERYRDDLWQ